MRLLEVFDHEALGGATNLSTDFPEVDACKWHGVFSSLRSPFQIKLRKAGTAPALMEALLVMEAGRFEEAGVLPPPLPKQVLCGNP